MSQNDSKKDSIQGRKCIRQGNIERMHQDRIPFPYIEGGMGLTDIDVKFEAILLTKIRRRIESEPFGERNPEEGCWLDERTRTAYGCTVTIPKYSGRCLQGEKN